MKLKICHHLPILINDRKLKHTPIANKVSSSVAQAKNKYNSYCSTNLTDTQEISHANKCVTCLYSCRDLFVKELNSQTGINL